jgi:hypothetical protein
MAGIVALHVGDAGLNGAPTKDPFGWHGRMKVAGRYSKPAVKVNQVKSG